MEKYPGQYVLLVEGSVPVKDGGVYCMIGGRTALQILEETADKAAAVIAWAAAPPTAASRAPPRTRPAPPDHKLIRPPVINVPGCPPIADVMTGVITHLVVLGHAPELDTQGRPKSFYGRRVHDTCYRRAYYDAGLFVEAWDDENARKGFCLYKMGCRGPVTYNACSVTRWNATSATRSSPATAASLQRGRLLGQRPFYSTWRRSPASASSPPPTPSARSSASARWLASPPTR